MEEFFEENKLRLPALNSDEAGFKIPQRVEVYYVAAAFDDFLQEEKAKISKDEIAEYYEENKDDFREAEEEFPVDEIDPNDPRNAVPSPPVVPEEEGSDENGAVDETSGEDAPSEDESSEEESSGG